jgi:hypothetical protein
MTRLWTNDRDTLAEALFHAYAPGRKTWRDASGMRRRGWLSQADRLLATGVVRVLDPDDTELVEQTAKTIYEWHHGAEWEYAPKLVRAQRSSAVRDVFVALGQP